MTLNQRPALPQSSVAALPSGSGLLTHLVESARPVGPDRCGRDQTAGWAVSLLLHAGVIVIGGLIAREVATLPTPVKEQTVTAVSAIDDGPALPEVGSDKTFTRPLVNAVDLQVGDATSEFFETNTQRLTESALAGGGSALNDAGPGPSRGAGPGIGFGGAGTTLGRAPFGRPDGVGSSLFAPPAAGPAVKKIVYLTDATGTMVGLRFDLVRAEIKRSLAALKPTQSYSVMFFQDEGFASVDKGKLAPALPDNLKKTVAFLDTFAARGRTNPIPAIEAAFAQKPDVIYFLTDGEFDDLVSYDDVIARFKELNSKHTTRVMTILFGDRDKNAEMTLQKIAMDHDGVFTFIDPESLSEKKK